MDIIKRGSAGTLESSDAYVEIEPGNGELDIRLESVVMAQFGDNIRETVTDMLNQQQVTNAIVRISDRGALECVIRARMEAAILRGRGQI